MSDAYSPAKAEEVQKELIASSEVIAVVNLMLAKQASSRRITIFQSEVVSELEKRGIERATIFAEHLLDFENAYRDQGWDVTYDKPGYSESYDANWTFTKK